MGLWYGTLMVTKNGDHSVGLVVCIKFLLDGSVVRSLLVKLNLESLRSVEGTENLSGKSLHIPVKVSVQLGGLFNADDRRLVSNDTKKNGRAHEHDRVEHRHPSCSA